MSENSNSHYRKTKKDISGISWMLASCFFASLLFAIIKILTMRGISPFQILFVRSIWMIIIISPVIIKSKFEVIKTKNIKLHGLKNLVDFIGSIMYFYAVTLTTLPNVVSLGFILPIINIILSAIFLKEKISKHNLLVLFIGIAGVGMVCKSILIESKLDVHAYSVFLLIFVGSLFWSVCDMSMKKLSKTDSGLAVSFYMAVFFIIFSSPFLLKFSITLNFIDYLLLVLLSLVAYAVQICMIRAFSHSSLSVLQPFEFSKLFFASIIAYYIFHEKTSLITIVGVVVMFISGKLVLIFKKYEKQLIEAKEKLERTQRVRDSFFANMSHELRTPLNSILGNSEIIQDKLFGSDINDEYVKCASKINKSGYKLLNLINDILIISKINSDKLKLGLQESNVNEIIKESIELISTEAKRKNIKITQNFINNCFINVDRQKIERVFNNILSNAVKFTNKNGEIKISITEDKNYIQIVVEDNGIGIKEGDIERILCEYECINNGFSRESREQGTGLGLPIVKKIVELHKGIFSINSIFGEGTKITIKLPK